MLASYARRSRAAILRVGAVEHMAAAVCEPRSITAPGRIRFFVFACTRQLSRWTQEPFPDRAFVFEGCGAHTALPAKIIVSRFLVSYAAQVPMPG